MADISRLLVVQIASTGEKGAEDGVQTARRVALVSRKKVLQDILTVFVIILYLVFWNLLEE